MTEDADTLIVRARSQLLEAQQRLMFLLDFNCPGEHEPTYDEGIATLRCPYCGYTADGQKVR